MLFELVCPNGIGTDYSEHYAIFSVKWQSGGSGGGHKASVEGQRMDIRHQWRVRGWMKALVEGRGVDGKHQWRVRGWMESISGGPAGGHKASVESSCMEGSEFDFCFKAST